MPVTTPPPLPDAGATREPVGTPLGSPALKPVGQAIRRSFPRARAGRRPIEMPVTTVPPLPDAGAEREPIEMPVTFPPHQPCTCAAE